MVVINENRLFANKTRYVQNMADLVLRDRNHPSVIIWSFCNEVGCEGFHEYGGPSFQNITKTLDPTRPTLANMFTYNDLLSNTIDIQGFSHRPRAKLDECHKQLPNKPIVQSECCSCNTMRNEDEGCETYSDNPHTTCNQKSFNGRCLEKLVNASDGTQYASGTFVWTLFDYYGEPPSRGLTVSSTYGQYDLCGFPKSAAFWFRSQWLLQSPSPSSSSSSSYGRSSSSSSSSSSINIGKPFFSNGIVEVHIVESWESPDHWNETKGNTTRTIHAYSNAPVIELFVSTGGSGSNEFTKSKSRSQSQGKRYLTPMIEGDQGTYGEWFDVPWKFGSITAIAQTIDGAELARTTKKTNIISANAAVAGMSSDDDDSNGVSLVLSLDCPSPHTGTGNALFLDGQDVALVRATIVDSTGISTLYFATHNITFRIISGPGYIQGTANGDPKSYQSHTSKSQTAYHGLVRAVVRVTSLAGLSSYEKDMMQQIETSATILDNDENDADDNDDRRLSFKDDKDIVLEATSPGLAPTRLVIPTSTNRNMESVLAIASQGANRPVNFF
jgi:prepilin-type processing-associated H-X9-DG protein